jgi:hypothetical protein
VSQAVVSGGTWWSGSALVGERLDDHPARRFGPVPDHGQLHRAARGADQQRGRTGGGVDRPPVKAAISGRQL